MTKNRKKTSVLECEIKVHCAHDKLLDITDLVPNPRNPNKHPDEQIALLAKIIRAQGWRAPITVSERSGFITKGHGRLEAAKLLGVEKVPVDLQPYANEAQEWQDMIADNRIAELAEMDLPAVKDLLQELDNGENDMDLTGYDEQALEDLMTQFHVDGEEDAEPQIDKAEELAKKWNVKLGQVWQLGEHRLMCGDSTKKEDVEKLMEGKRSNLCLTDPPYGIGEDYDQFDDSENSLAALIKGFLPIARNISEIVLLTPGNKNQNFYPKSDWTLAWFVPAGVGMGPWGFTCWQPVLAYGKCPYLASGLGSRPDALCKMESSENNLGHPCAKPLGVWKWFLERGSIEIGDLIYEPFSGSGTTLIACENLSRKCRAMEISPGYVAVAIQRWVDVTSKEPKLLP